MTRRAIWRDTDKVVEEDAETGEQVTTWTNPHAPGARAAHAQNPDSSLIINVTAPPPGLTPWVGDGRTDNTAAILETFTYANSWTNRTRAVVYINIGWGTYRHAGVDLSHLIWNNLSARVIVTGVQGQRRATLWCTRGDVPNVALSAAWQIIFNDVSFYQGLYGLKLVNSQYVEINGCVFEQQARAGACVRLESGQNINLSKCRFLQSHSAFLSLASSTTAFLRDCIIGEAIQGATVAGSTLWIQNCALFGVGSGHTADGAAFNVAAGGSLSIQQCSIRLASDVAALVSTNSPGPITIQNSRISRTAPLTLFACGTQATYDYPPIMFQGNSVTGAHPLVLASFGDAARVPRNSLVTGNVFSFTFGAVPSQVVPPEMLDEARNSLVSGNITRASTGSI